ncbi:MAG: cation:proton antiporter [Oscillospiraceae bacterium]|nr:cation:proton antiporter [Oscillospiraceae bacterium]
MFVLLTVAFALFAGLMTTRLFKLLKLNFPDVTAYLIAGLLVGPYGLGRLGISGIGFSSYEAVEHVDVIINAALGFIAFTIGNEFRLSQLRHTGRQAVVISIWEGVSAAVLVDVCLLAVHFILGDKVLNIPAAITLGAIAAATAPAATLMVVRQYKAKGPLTDVLLPVVALDDAVGLIVFAVSFGIAQAMLGGSVSVVSIIMEPLIEIVGSLLLGAAMGALLTALEKLFFSNSNRLSLTIAFVLMTIGLSGISFQIGAVHVSFSTLLVCMMLGTVFCNLCPRSVDIMSRSDRWTAPLFALFFVVSGAELQLSVFSNLAVISIGVIYIVARVLGKYFGARFGSAIVHCEPTVQKYLGFTLAPQAGVALGMCVTASSLGTYEGALVRNIVLFGVLIYELTGPMITKTALTKAGEIQNIESDKTTHQRFSVPQG